jgi:RNA polymerase sigma-70 factor, ECF subfamily
MVWCGGSGRAWRCRELDPVMLGSCFASLLAAAVGGDEQAFARLWRDLHPAVLRYLRVVAPDAAEDVASETWLEVVRGLGGFSGDEGGFRSWVFTIARHRALDEHRRRARRLTVPLPVELAVGWQAADDPADQVVQGLSTRAALAVIAQLPRDQAEVVLLRVVAGLGVEQVARLLGRRPGAVRVLAHRGLRRLAERLGPEQQQQGLFRGRSKGV